MPAIGQSRKTAIAIAVAILVLVVVAGVVFTQSVTNQSPYGVGAVLPLTGSAAIWGKNSQRGINLALPEINDHGGIKGRKITVLYEDSQSEPRIATSALQKLITIDHVPAVIGDIASSSVLAMAPIAEANKVVLLSPGASNPDISNAGKYIFRNWQSDALEGRLDAQYAASSLKWKRVAILFINNAYGAGLAKVFTETFTRTGAQVIASESFAQGATDMRAQITKIASLKPDGIYMPGYPPEMAIILKQMKELGAAIPILSVQAFDDPSIIASVGAAADGVIYSIPKPPEESNPVVANFKKKYANAYGEQPGVTSDTGYDAIRIIAYAIEHGGYSGPQIRAVLATLKDFPGAAGPTTFDSHGDVNREFEFIKIANGKTVPTEGK
jgi:branched-chain amino acid transport system substrate-binding protein